MPMQVVSNVSLKNITGWTASFSRISGPTNSSISGIHMENVGLIVADTNYAIKGVNELNIGQFETKGCSHC
jgi:hypothetical protein